MKRYRELLESGKKLLYENDALKALSVLGESLELCDSSDHFILGEIFFFMGIAFRKIGQQDQARRCWLNAFRVRDRERLQHAEWNLFHSMHITRYLSRKHGFQFDTLAEGDMVYDLIKSAWLDLISAPGFSSLPEDERIRRYVNCAIIFPVPEHDPTGLAGCSGKPEKGKSVSLFSIKKNTVS